MRKDCNNIVEELKIKARILIQEAPGNLSYTSDMWTSNQNLGYLFVTCHFIDKDWKLQKLVLAFRVVPSPHTGIVISETLFECFNEWNVASKILAVTVDNATSNDAALKNLKYMLDEQNMLIADGSLLHQRCCAHILNLIVSDGLKMVKHIVSKVRECSKWIHSSQARQQNFEDAIVGCCVELVSRQCPVLDVPTRWNSVYLMLVSTILYKNVFGRLALRDSNFEQIMPSDEDWRNAKVICDFLKPFYDVTNIISGTTYSTSNIFLPHLIKIKTHLERNITNVNSFISQMVVPMQSKFEKYWEKVEDMHCIASMMDPRYKLSLLTHIYKEKMQLSCSEAEEKLISIKMKATEIYKSTYMRNTAAFDNYDFSTTISQDDDLLKDFDRFLANSQSSAMNKMDELEQYFTDPLVPRSSTELFDVLDWWKENELRYPSVAAMARDILAIPITSVASESIFSIAGRIVDDY